jgi:hypothetical protein
VNKLLLHVVPALIVPGVFGYCLWGTQYADGWESLLHASCLGVTIPLSAIVGATCAALALIQRRRGRQDWRWWLVSAGVVGSPAVFTLVRQAY